MFYPSLFLPIQRVESPPPPPDGLIILALERKTEVIMQQPGLPYWWARYVPPSYIKCRLGQHVWWCGLRNCFWAILEQVESWIGCLKKYQKCKSVLFSFFPRILKWQLKTGQTDMYYVLFGCAHAHTHTHTHTQRKREGERESLGSLWENTHFRLLVKLSTHLDQAHKKKE